MGLFDLPNYWAYVEYENGKRECVMNTDTLSQKEADWVKDEWETVGKIVRVTLETRGGKVLKEYRY